ncbi:MAG: SPOR domain-containing protein [Steroidobacteraceae bacterium]
MSAARTRLTSRDFKHGGRGQSLPAARIRDFGAGLAIGLVVALGIYVSDHRNRDEETAAETEPRPQARADAPDTAAEAEADPAPQYDFYDMLPKFEVVVPERGERDVRGSAPAAPVTKPGVYVLQAGSYRNQADAERVRSQLGKQGIEATVQRVQVDADVWHRVRVGPFSDLARLETARENLRRADVDTIVVRVGD